MNPIATQALASALGKALAASLPNVPPPQTFADVLVQLDLNDIDTSGPINQVMFREGQAFALDVVRSAGRTIADPKLAARLVQNLIRSALGRPPSYALGIKKIIELMQVNTTASTRFPPAVSTRSSSPASGAVTGDSS